MKKIFTLIVVLFLLGSTLLGRNVLFAYKAQEDVKSVCVIGTFNNWSPTAGKMKKVSSNVWMTTINIPDGVYFYNFLVDGKVIVDPTNPRKKSNGNGGYYSILIVGAFTPPKGKTNDGVVHTNYVIFNENSRIYVNPASTKTIYFSIDTLKDDVAHVYFNSSTEVYEMKKCKLNSYTDRYEITYHPTVMKFKYSFTLKDGTTTFYYGNKGISSTPSSFVFDFAKPSVPILNAPTWAKGAVVYEIFPDRFFNGNSSNDPSYTTEWGETPTYDNFFGGDLEGIRDKIGYLKKLGVDVLYTTPIFESPSNHKYNTTNYLKIDPHFGTLQTFEEVLNALHSKDMKWVLDGVFNHTGTSFFAFQDILKKQKKSKYVDWYFIKRFPVKIESGDYLTFQKFPSLPKLNTMNPNVQEYLKKVVDYWTKKGIDGWRIDSANVISNDFLIKLYGWIHKDNPSSLDVAEIWNNVSNWFYEGAFNSVMNYLFKDAAYSYIVYGTGAKSFLQETNSYLNSYPPQLWNALWNLIDSHDTVRALTMLNGNVKKMKLLVGLQMTFIGAPMIYYGDEIGLTGGKDPLNRKCMIWNQRKWNTQLYEWYGKLIKLRHDSDAIRYGQYEPIMAEGDVLGFERSYKKEDVYVFLNASNNSQELKLNLRGTFVDLLTDNVFKGNSSTLKVLLKPYTMVVLEKM